MRWQSRAVPLSAVVFAGSSATCEGKPTPTHAVIDSGARNHVCGSLDCFPPNLITNKTPNACVRVASGARYPVAFVGTIVLRSRGEQQR